MRVTGTTTNFLRQFGKQGQRSLSAQAVSAQAVSAPSLGVFGKGRILVTGSTGQLGTEIVPVLKNIFGSNDSVVSSDVKIPGKDDVHLNPFVFCDVTTFNELNKIVVENRVCSIIHLASLLSANGEKNPHVALKVNNLGFQNVLEVAREHKCAVFSPSSIAVFGPTTPKVNTPDLCPLQPSTIYGITKVHVELLGNYYFQRYGVDFRSVRYPGIISHTALPGGGTTDYAVHIFYEALKNKSYTCFLSENTRLPMMYMPDCLDGTLQLLAAPRESLKQSVYNLGGFSFTPKEIEEEIRKHIPGFTVKYVPDFRQAIADSWPQSICDDKAREDWKWSPKFNLSTMVKDMLEQVAKKLEKSSSTQ